VSTVQMFWRHGGECDGSLNVSALCMMCFVGFSFECRELSGK
jgi:hypothetical protein